MKAEMAPCWKLVWNVEPAPAIVPLADEVLVLVLGDELAADVGDVAADDDELDDEDEHAARAMAAATAPDAAATCLPRNCIREFSL